MKRKQAVKDAFSATGSGAPFSVDYQPQFVPAMSRHTVLTAADAKAAKRPANAMGPAVARPVASVEKATRHMRQSAMSIQQGASSLARTSPATTGVNAAPAPMTLAQRIVSPPSWFSGDLSARLRRALGGR